MVLKKTGSDSFFRAGLGQRAPSDSEGGIFWADQVTAA